MKPRSLWLPREPGPSPSPLAGAKVRKMTPKLVRKIRALVARIHAEHGGGEYVITTCDNWYRDGPR